MSGHGSKSATRKGCRRKVACGHTCTATLTCESIQIYIGIINRIKKLFDIHRNIYVNSYLINILIRVIMHYLSHHASIYPYTSPQCQAAEVSQLPERGAGKRRLVATLAQQHLRARV